VTGTVRAAGFGSPATGDVTGRLKGWSDMTHDHEHRDVIVENRGGGLGTILGVIVILALLVGIWYFAFGPGQGTFQGATEGGGTDINVDVNLPSVEPAGS
jgi:hypothetical protein